jgi:hypothetical protein
MTRGSAEDLADRFSQQVRQALWHVTDGQRRGQGEGFSYAPKKLAHRSRQSLPNRLNQLAANSHISRGIRNYRIVIVCRQFAAQNANVWWSLDANTHLIAADSQYRNRDLISDPNLFLLLASEDQHGRPPLS